MRILILGQPRQGTTKLCGVMSSMFGLKDYNEDIHDAGEGRDVQKMREKLTSIRNNNDFCVKFFHTMEEFDWTIFDLIVTTSRNLADSEVSMYVASRTNNYIKYNGAPEWGELSHFVIPWNCIRKYKIPDHNALQEKIVGRALPNFTYDEICDDSVLIEKIKNLGFPVTNPCPVITSIPTNNDYREKCVNYDIIEKVVGLEYKSELKHLRLMQYSREMRYPAAVKYK